MCAKFISLKMKVVATLDSDNHIRLIHNTEIYKKTAANGRKGFELNNQHVIKG